MDLLEKLWLSFIAAQRDKAPVRTSRFLILLYWYKWLTEGCTEQETGSAELLWPILFIARGVKEWEKEALSLLQTPSDIIVLAG